MSDLIDHMLDSIYRMAYQQREVGRMPVGIKMSSQTWETIRERFGVIVGQPYSSTLVWGLPVTINELLPALAVQMEWEADNE